MELGTAVGELRWWTVPIAAASMFALGGLWYGALFARPWQALVGLTDDEVGSGTGRVFGVAAAASLVIAAVLALFIGVDAGLGTGVSAGLLAGVGWLAPALAMTYAFERRSPRLAAIDAGYHVLAFALAGAILGVLG